MNLDMPNMAYPLNFGATRVTRQVFTGNRIEVPSTEGIGEENEAALL
jgi:hypothetical protein